MLQYHVFLAYLSQQYSTKADNLKRFFFLFILLASLITTSCIPAAIGVAGWYMSVTDEKQILADKTECEDKAMKLSRIKKQIFRPRKRRKKNIKGRSNISKRIHFLYEIQILL